VPPSVVHGMKAAGAAGGGRWRTDRNEGWSHRVLWSESKQIALRVESQRDDGSVRRVVTVKLQPAAARAPWRELTDYTPKHYDDFMD
jgi:hypothetical protein